MLLSQPSLGLGMDGSEAAQRILLATPMSCPSHDLSGLRLQVVPGVYGGSVVFAGDVLLGDGNPANFRP
jgi:hypothetical protein